MASEKQYGTAREVAFPQINRNGGDVVKHLLRPHCTLQRLVVELQQGFDPEDLPSLLADLGTALRETEPHGRDYQTYRDAGSTYRLARQQYSERLLGLKFVIDQFQAESMTVALESLEKLLRLLFSDEEKIIANIYDQKLEREGE